MTLQEHIQTLNTHFVNEILASNYEILEIGECSVYLQAKSGHKFNLWIGSHPDFVGIHPSFLQPSFMMLEFSKQHCQTIFSRFAKLNEQKKQEAKREMISKLQAELQ